MPESNMNICYNTLAVYPEMTDVLLRHLHSDSLKMFFLLRIQYLACRLLYENHQKACISLWLVP